MKSSIKMKLFLLINGFYKFVFFVCSLFPIKNERIYVVGFGANIWSDHPKYILSKLYEIDNAIEVFWASKENESHVEFVHNVRPKSLKSMYYQATSKIWISCNRLPFYCRKRKHQIYIQTWHGSFGLKKSEGETPDALSDIAKKISKHDSSMITYLLSDSEAFSDFLSNYFWYYGNGILKIGSPRNDNLVCPSVERIIMLKNKYNLDGKRVLLYAPTFRINHDLSVYDIDYCLLQKHLENLTQEEWTIVIRLHPSIKKMSSELVQYNDKIIDGSYIKDVQELLEITDILITDYSSIIFDYMLTNRPGFIYAKDINEYAKERNYKMDLHETPFPVATNMEELVSNIDSLNKEKYKEELLEFRKNLGYYNQKDASGIIAQIIRKHIREEKVDIHMYI